MDLLEIGDTMKHNIWTKSQIGEICTFQGKMKLLVCLGIFLWTHNSKHTTNPHKI